MKYYYLDTNVRFHKHITTQVLGQTQLVGLKFGIFGGFGVRE